MAKALTEPLFLALGALLLLQAWSWVRARGEARFPGEPTDGLLRALALAVTLALWAASTAAGARLAMQPLEDPYTGFAGLEEEPDHVVVLTGGLWPGPRPGLDLPNGWSAARLDRGVDVFLESDARHLVITGGVPRPRGERGDLGRLLRERAQRMGVPEDRILLETHSANTREHPVEVTALHEVGPEARVAVVTSAWHLPRALGEFRRHFQEVEGVPAEFAAPKDPVSPEWLLPSSRHLRTTTHAVHEYVGRAWYALRAVGP